MSRPSGPRASTRTTPRSGRGTSKQTEISVLAGTRLSMRATCPKRRSLLLIEVVIGEGCCARVYTSSLAEPAEGPPLPPSRGGGRLCPTDKGDNNFDNDFNKIMI